MAGNPRKSTPKVEKYPSVKKVILSLVFLLVVTILSISSIIFYSVTSVNDEARITSEGFVKAIINDKLKSQESLTKDYAFWDETIENAYLSHNVDWIEKNIGEYLTDTFKVTDQFIINNNDVAVLSLKDGKDDKANFKRIDGDALSNLIVRARESGPGPVSVSGIMMINGTPALVGVCVLTPEDLEPFKSPLPLLVLATRLDSSYMQIISDQYRLKALQFTDGNTISKESSHITLKDPLNNSLGALSWQLDKPGDMVLAKLQFPLLLLLVIITFITGFIIKASRATARRLDKAYDDLAFNANHDALTGLANRRLFNELLKQTISLVKRDKITCTMLYIDLDDFKLVNDTYGHKTGDQLLIQVAERLRSCVRDSDTVSRIGGDEFTILLQNTEGKAQVKSLAKKIIAQILEPFRISDIEVRVSASVGVTMIPDDGLDADELMINADLALYRSKDLGRNTVQFYRETRQHVEN